MIMEDFENESNKNSSWSMSEISEPSSETSSSSSSTNLEPECSPLDSKILDEIDKKNNKAGRINLILIFTLMTIGSFTTSEHHDMIKVKPVTKTPVTFEIQ